MGISVAIPTFNRADELRKTLETLRHVRPPNDCDYEILIIDNNSTDGTQAVIDEFSREFAGRMRGVCELQQGLNHARNRAVREARYEIVAFLDDDVDIDPQWLTRLSAAHTNNEYAAIGGKAYLVYPSSRPAWLDSRSEGLLSKVDHGDEPRIAQPDEVFGLNLSIKKHWIRRVGEFRPDLDRIGKCLLSGGELELLERIAAAGGVIYYEPAAVVGHRVPASRLCRRWFWSRCYWGYRGQARMTPPEELRAYILLRSTWRVARAIWSVARTTVTNGPSSKECFHQTRLLASRWGYWVGLVGRVLSFRRPAESIVPVESDPMCTRTRAHDLQHQTS